MGCFPELPWLFLEAAPLPLVSPTSASLVTPRTGTNNCISVGLMTPLVTAVTPPWGQDPSPAQGTAPAQQLLLNGSSSLTPRVDPAVPH